MPFHSYIFFDGTSRGDKKKFISCIEKSRDVSVQAYATLGLKGGSRFMLHCNAKSPDAIQNLVRDALHTPFGSSLNITYTLLGATRSSQYNPQKPPAEMDFDRPHRYLIVYPFTKTDTWYALPYEKRRKIMGAHVAVGKKFSSKISQLLLYSFGLDDPEFIVSYAMDSLEDFQSLVIELRSTEARRYTKSDTPIFTCIHRSLAEALEMA